MTSINCTFLDIISSLCNGQVSLLVSWIHLVVGTKQQLKMKLVNILCAFLVYNAQNVQGIFYPYEIEYLKEVPVLWPYSHYYYLAYPEQPQHINVSYFSSTSES